MSWHETDTFRTTRLESPDDLVALLCAPERGCCALCNLQRLVLRIATDDLNDPAFCMACLRAMHHALVIEAT